MYLSIREIIDAAGGNVEVAKILKIDESTVCGWKADGKKIPAKYYYKFESRLGELPAKFFGFKR